LLFHHALTLTTITTPSPAPIRERKVAIKRRSALVIGNMCKLVNDPRTAALFYPILKVSAVLCALVCCCADAQLLAFACFCLCVMM
jgi:hypothetical protein